MRDAARNDRERVAWVDREIGERAFELADGVIAPARSEERADSVRLKIRRTSEFNSTIEGGDCGLGPAGE